MFGCGIYASAAFMLENTLFTAIVLYRVAPKKPGTVNYIGLCSDQQLSIFTLLDRASFPHYNNTKIIKFGGELLC